ncbi:nuclear transport factor 2 family protein [Pelomonas sp. KK5]|uniref:nuclear transport factor 2 family protein n=1 Tax=Pelomonas sp. KK5 TaxID=1855730 RepID=UPI00097BE41B|nr:nuclear transport factor 2 family protein [Pelomonas sp. KK5]
MMNQSDKQMRAALQAYVDALNAKDLAGVVDLYAEDATLEDPVGGPVLQGRAAIEAFYGRVVPLGLEVRMVAEPRGSHGNAAAMAFEVVAPTAEGGRARIKVIDVFTFDAAGKFTSMKAYWGPEDVGLA